MTDEDQDIKLVADYPRGAKGAVCDFVAALMLLTRIPLPWQRLTAHPPDMQRALWAFPLVGLVVSVVGSVVYYLFALSGLPFLLAATLAILTMIFTTGAFHEDGLADVADGFGGGYGRDKKLEIMRDSRVGTYGSIAVFMSLALRIIPLGSMSFYGAIVALLISGSLSRYSILAMLRLLPSARTEGTGTVAGVPDDRQLLIAGLIPLALCVVWLSLAQIISVIVVTLGAVFALAYLSHRQVGGYTGDVLGAVQQVSEIAILITLLYWDLQI